MKRAVPKLAGLAEVAALLAARAGKDKVSRTYAAAYVKRDDFPPPVDRLAMGPVWAEAEVIEYLAVLRKPGRIPKT